MLKQLEKLKAKYLRGFKADQWGIFPTETLLSHHVLQLKGAEDTKMQQRMLFPADVMTYEKTGFVQSDLTLTTGHAKKKSHVQSFQK